MKILIFNENTNPISDSQNEVQHNLEVHLKQLGHEVNVMQTSQLQIAGCTGCWSCWLNKPGYCSVNDDQIPFIQAILAMDLVIMMSPVRRGFISAQLKNSIDRLIPISLPFFHMKEGQLTHLHRYDRAANMALLLEYETVLDKKNESVITNWINRFCWHSQADCFFVSDLADIESVKNKLLSLTN